MEEATIIKTEYYVANAFMEANLAQRNATAGQRFGNFRHVASTPMHIWAKEIAPRQQQGDLASPQALAERQRPAPLPHL